MECLHPRITIKWEAVRTFQGGQQTGWNYAWVNSPEEGGFASLQDALYAWRYSSNLHKNGDVEIDCFYGEKWGDDPQLYDVLAPFVKDGGVVFCRGEDGQHIFKNGHCEEAYL